VVCDGRGVADFEALRSSLAHREDARAFLYAFDVMELDGKDLRREPWEARRRALTRLLRRAADGIRLSEHMGGLGRSRDVPACVRYGSRRGRFEAARREPYRSGRSTDWIKVKNPDAPAATRIIER
jgi:bifunctional non-homologous end joining protein LigD